MAHHESPIPRKSRSAISIIATLVLLAVALSGTAFAAQHENGAGPDEPGQQGGPPENGADRERAMQQAHERRESWQALSEERKEDAMDRAQSAGLFARFTAENGTAQGRFVSFDYDDEAGEITEYTYHGSDDALFFDTVSLDPYTKTHDATAAGAVFLMPGEGSMLRAHNNPVGLLHAMTNNTDATITFTLSTNASVGSEDNRSITIDADGQEGHLIMLGNGTLSVNDTEVSFEFAEEGGGALFMTRSEMSSARTANQDERIEALKQGRLGAEMSVVATEGTPVEDVSEYGVTMRTTQAESGSLSVRAESDNPEGRVVTMEFEADVLGVESAEEVLVELDGEAAERVATAREILASVPDEQATYHVERVGEAFSLTLGIPHFSEREITVDSTEEDEGTDQVSGGGDGDGGEEDTPALTAGVFMALGLAMFLVALARNRQDERR